MNLGNLWSGIQSYGLPLVPGYTEGLNQRKALDAQRAQQAQQDAWAVADRQRQDEDYQRKLAAYEKQQDEQTRLMAPYSAEDYTLADALAKHSLTPEMLNGLDPVRVQRAGAIVGLLPKPTYNPYAISAKPEPTPGAPITLRPVGVRPKVNIMGEAGKRWLTPMGSETPQPVAPVRPTATPTPAPNGWMQKATAKIDAMLPQFVEVPDGKGWHYEGNELTNPVSGKSIIPNPSLPQAEQNRLAREMFHTQLAIHDYQQPSTAQAIGKPYTGQVAPLVPTTQGATPTQLQPTSTMAKMEALPAPEWRQDYTVPDLITARRNMVAQSLGNYQQQGGLITQEVIKQAEADALYALPDILADLYTVAPNGTRISAKEANSLGEMFYDPDRYNFGNGMPAMKPNDYKTMVTLPNETLVPITLPDGSQGWSKRESSAGVMANIYNSKVNSGLVPTPRVNAQIDATRANAANTKYRTNVLMPAQVQQGQVRLQQGQARLDQQQQRIDNGGAKAQKTPAEQFTAKWDNYLVPAESLSTPGMTYTKDGKTTTIGGTAARPFVYKGVTIRSEMGEPLALKNGKTLPESMIQEYIKDVSRLQLAKAGGQEWVMRNGKKRPSTLLGLFHEAGQLQNIPITSLR